jgi:hypothetical protein
MKSFVPVTKIRNYLSLVILYSLVSVSVNAQTYNTIANGPWSSASTWQGGSIPNAANIPLTAVINIKHTITYSGADISNNGIINISNQSGLSPRLIVASGITLTNQLTGKIIIIGGEYRQYRFAGGGESGTPLSGSFVNAGGTIYVKASFVEIANEWKNQNAGTRYIKNSSVVLGTNYSQTSNAIDTLEYTSVSVGAQGNGDFSIAGSYVSFQSVRIEVASTAGNFKLSGCVAIGDIDYITQKNHVTNIFSTGTIEIKNSVVTTGINIDAYCASSPANYICNGKAIGTQTPDCSLNYFPAKLFASATPGALNFSNSSVLVSGSALQVGAIYKFEGITPGIDAIVSVDSLINGATLNTIDDNSGGLGYLEGFQPEVKSGTTVGESYAVFTMSYKITGTSEDYPLATFDITALDIDGNATLKEFDQIIATPGATASYMSTSTDITLTQVAPGSFKGINIAGIERSGIDTASKANMFTVSATNISSVKLKLGTVKTNTQQTARQYGIFFKGFVYPSNQTLPVKLESFTATLSSNGKNADLRWTTSSEIRVSHFVVEKSTDGVNFSGAGIVFANGNATDRANYSFSDNVSAIQSGIVYYRLRTVDNDGKGQYSETRIIRISKANMNNITIVTFPNPVTNELRVTIPSSWQNKKVTYELFNANGQVSKKTENASSNQTETLNMSSLATGFYIMKVTCNGEIAQQKIIKQ